MKEGEDIEKRKAGQQSIPVNIWSKRKEHNALHENTSNTKRKSYDKCEKIRIKKMMKWENQTFLDQKCKTKMKTRATKTEKCQMELELKMDKSVNQR